MTDFQKWYNYQSPPQHVYNKNGPIIPQVYTPPKSEPICTPPNQPLRYDRDGKEDNKKIRVKPIPESPRGEVMIFKMDFD